MNNKIEKLNLHEHNKVAYEKVKKSFQVNNRCCVIHPTGTGKSFISLALIADHLDPVPFSSVVIVFPVHFVQSLSV